MRRRGDGYLRGITGTIAVLLWLLLFATGLTIDSKPYRDVLSADAPEAPEHPHAKEFDVNAYLMVICAYTPLNVAILTLLAGFVGGCASNMTYNRVRELGTNQNTGLDDRTTQKVMFRTENPIAVCRQRVPDTFWS